MKLYNLHNTKTTMYWQIHLEILFSSEIKLSELNSKITSVTDRMIQKSATFVMDKRSVGTKSSWKKDLTKKVIWEQLKKSIGMLGNSLI